MQVKLEIGSSGYIIESNRIITNVTVIAKHGEFYVLRMPTGGAIKLRRVVSSLQRKMQKSIFHKRSKHRNTFIEHHTIMGIDGRGQGYGKGDTGRMSML